jgi:hypothetical protein
MKKFIAVILFVLIFSPLFADTHTAASCSRADVGTAITAASSGDTVSVPAGSATWDTNLVITKGLYIIGAGIGSTNITSNYTGSGDRLNTSGFIISYEPATPALNEPFRLSGFTFNCAAKCYGIFLHISGATPITQVRVDHNRVYNVSTTGDGPRHTIALHGAIWGVADNNIFDSGYQSVDGYDPEWSVRNFYFGTADMWYFEDNTFIGGGSGLCIIRSADSARWCSRYNIYDATSCTGGLYPWHDAHGNQPSACNSVMGVEIYNNTLTIGSYGVDIFQQRGGKSLCYNNTVNGASAVDTEVEEEYLDSLNPPANSPNGQPQHISDSYFWNNLLNGTGNSIAVVVSGSPLYYSDLGRYVPLVNVDYWYQYATFNGSQGVGVGLLSARPSSGLTIGVGYWATDTSTLYRATGATTWETYYTPYTYPHPLRGEGENYPKATVGAGAKIVIEAGGKLVIK